jgi:hypothetical protein
MRLAVLALALAAATPLAALTPDEEKATALITPMMAEIAPGPAAAVLTACIVAAATEAELAIFVAAPGPSMEIGAQINTILNRADTLACIQTAAGQ